MTLDELKERLSAIKLKKPKKPLKKKKEQWQTLFQKLKPK